MMVLGNLLNPIFSPLLAIPPIFGIIIISFFITLIITLIYKWVTDQKLMKSLKMELKEFQKQMKKFKDNPKKMMEIQKKSMEKNMQYMMHSLKPTLFTLLPILIIFGWLSSHLAFYPLAPNEKFEITAEFDKNAKGYIELNVPSELTLYSSSKQDIMDEKVVWILSGPEGDYNLEIDYAGISYDKELIISEESGNYAQPVMSIKGSALNKIIIGNEKIKPLGSVSIFGWHPGWLAIYIIFSILFSSLLRKVLDVH